MPIDEQISGMPWWEQLFNYRIRFAPLTGIFLIVIMAAMYLTALPCARRGTNCCTRRLGGFNLFLASTRKLEACVFVAIVACPATALDLVLLSSYLRDYRQDDAGCQNLMSDRNQ